MKKERSKLETMTIEYNKFPSFSVLPKKDFDVFISCLEIEIRDYYAKQQSSTKKVPP